MSAPTYSSPYNRGPVEVAPKSIRLDAERLVIQAAREYVASRLKPDLTATEAGEKQNRLTDAVRVLDVLEGKRPE